MVYNNKFITSKDAHAYDTEEYSVLSIGSLLWEIEKDLLGELINTIKLKKNFSYLDFACGTGRIVSFVAAYTENSTAIDISKEMIFLAIKRSPKTKFLAKDITLKENIEGKYNLITSFRFLSNVETQKRIEVLYALRSRMESDSILIINSHTNPFSYKIFLFPWHILKKIMGYNVHTQYLSNMAMKKILNQAGFIVEEIIGYGFIPGKLLPIFSWNVALNIEKYLFRIKILRHIGVNQIAICRPKPI